MTKHSFPPFLTPEEIATKIVGEMSAADKDFLMEDIKDAEGMIEFHHSTGRSIRNEFGLNRAEYPHGNGKHPDELSHGILKRVWEIVKLERT